MSKLVALGKNVVVEVKAKEQKKGSLYIPDAAQEKSTEAVVIEVGPEVSNKYLDSRAEIVAGDVVIYGKFAGTEVDVDGKKFLILKDTDILAKIV